MSLINALLEEMSVPETRRVLRRLGMSTVNEFTRYTYLFLSIELEAYACVVSALRAQGQFTLLVNR